MNKNQKRRKNRDKKDPHTQTQDVQTQDVQKEDEKPFDFGGLQVRDLKKNLGCG